MPAAAEDRLADRIRRISDQDVGERGPGGGHEGASSPAPTQRQRRAMQQRRAAPSPVGGGRSCPEHAVQQPQPSKKQKKIGQKK